LYNILGWGWDYSAVVVEPIGNSNRNAFCRVIAGIDTTVLERIFRACLVVCRWVERKDIKIKRIA